jgi:2-polyprenyl-3-methyl-5-hydroxy-6-metoxy-1,4-benzoquinol methylase
MRDDRTATDDGGVLTLDRRAAAVRPAPPATYALPNEWEHARRRLQLLEQCYDPASLRRLAELVEPGWRCLEVGAGGGSITRWLCRAVGPTGRVAAVDLDTRFVEELEEVNVDIHRRDVVNDGLPEGTFDFIHTRALLVHIPERDAVLAQLAGRLRPGGWLLVEEPDNTLFLSLTAGRYGEAWSYIMAGLAAAGVAHNWARQLPSLLQGYGLADVQVECEIPYGAGGSSLAQFAQLSGRQLRERALTLGATVELLDEAESQLDDAARWFPGIPVMAVWGRRPV